MIRELLSPTRGLWLLVLCAVASMMGCSKTGDPKPSSPVKLPTDVTVSVPLPKNLVLEATLTPEWEIKVALGIEIGHYKIGCKTPIFKFVTLEGTFAWLPLEPEFNATIELNKYLNRTISLQSGAGFELIKKDIPMGRGIKIDLKTSLTNPKPANLTASITNLTWNNGRPTFQPLTSDIHNFNNLYDSPTLRNWNSVVSNSPHKLQHAVSVGISWFCVISCKN